MLAKLKEKVFFVQMVPKIGPFQTKLVQYGPGLCSGYLPVSRPLGKTTLVFHKTNHCWLFRILFYLFKFLSMELQCMKSKTAAIFCKSVSEIQLKFYISRSCSEKLNLLVGCSLKHISKLL